MGVSYTREVMPKDALDIIDTAVKIGLGALISGVTTYMITHKNHSNELSKESREKKSSILEFSVENIEPYFNAFESFISVIDGQLRLGNSPGLKTEAEWDEIDIWGDDEKLISTRDVKSITISRLNLIGLTELTEKLSLIDKVENEFRQQIIFDLKMPTHGELAGYRARFKKYKLLFYKELEVSFNSLYS